MTNLTEEPEDIISLNQITNTITESTSTESKLLQSHISTQCTYQQGYISQTIYSCLTCNDVFGKEAGICLACALTCHPKHKIIDVGKRRHFKCDCGTARVGIYCKLKNCDTDLITANTYNQNFMGKFCNCHKEYDEDDGEDMLQCGLCLDWFHESHIQLSKENEKEILKHEDDTEFICKSCTNNPLVLPYIHKWQQSTTVVEEPPLKKTAVENKESSLPAHCIKPKIQGKWDQDFILPSDWYDNLCKCSKCTQELETLHYNETMDEIYYELLEFGDFRLLCERKSKAAMISQLSDFKKQKFALLMKNFMTKAEERAKQNGNQPLNDKDVKDIFASLSGSE